MNPQLINQFRAKAQPVGERTRSVVLAELTHDGQVNIFAHGGPIDVYGLLGMAGTYAHQMAQAGKAKVSRVEPSPPPLPPFAENFAQPTPPPPPAPDAMDRIGLGAKRAVEAHSARAIGLEQIPTEPEPQMSFPFCNGDET
jgi:hypothetical protein